MSETLLNALVHLFAIAAIVRNENISSKGRAMVKTYLARYLSREFVMKYLTLFDNYYYFYKRERSESGDLVINEKSIISIQIEKVCRQIKKGLLRDERVIVIVQLLEFVYEEDITKEEIEFVETVSKTFNFSDIEFQNFNSFIADGNPDLLEKDKVLVIDNQTREWSGNVAWLMKKNATKQATQSKYIYRKNLYGYIVVLYIQSIESFVFRYFGELNLYLEGHKIVSGRSYFIKKGSIIKGPNITSIYYHDIAAKFIGEKQKHKLIFSAINLEYKFKNSQNGIQEFNFCEESGQLIGIMGGSGVGKSTLLNLLSGKIQAQKGKIRINNHNLNSQKQSLTGIIGFVPQDDLLFEELTVFQNLYYNAKLCFSDFTEQQIINKVNSVLTDLDLIEIKNLQVGNPLNKLISGGQRKRLNIGLELMREPLILFVDEPTSGLSSMDSFKVMNLLKDQTIKGKLVIINIHQPSSDIFKLLDKLWILDKGGFPIYQGNPIDALVYFKTISLQVNASESECITCGNVDTDDILQIIEAREIDEFGIETHTRKTNPKEWYDHYKKDIESKIEIQETDEDLPVSDFKIPGLLKQFRVFVMRNLLSKITNKQYLLINLLEAPILALILGYFTKYISINEYVFAENKNLPVYFFMAVIVAIFLGLSVSAEEIIKDRKILERESFLQLSWFSYINSKVLYLFSLSAIQAFLYVAIGNTILEINGMLFSHWLILFAAACMGNMIGLNISSGLNSVVAIYILIPLILVPKLLLGGAMIKYDDLHKSLTSRIYTPFIASIMTTRWAYEALAVEQFKNNKFNKIFFEVDKQISDFEFKTAYLLPQIQNKLELSKLRIAKNIDSSILVIDLNIITNELKSISEKYDFPPFEFINYININDIDEDIFEQLTGYLYYLKILITDASEEANKAKELIYNELLQDITREEFTRLKKDNHNKKIADIVLNRNEINKLYQTNSRLIQKQDPIYMEPGSNFGRAHFYAPLKIFLGKKIDTFWYNIIMMFIGCLILYFLLYFELLRKSLLFFQNIKLRRTIYMAKEVY